LGLDFSQLICTKLHSLRISWWRYIRF